MFCLSAMSYPRVFRFLFFVSTETKADGVVGHDYGRREPTQKEGKLGSGCRFRVVPVVCVALSLLYALIWCRGSIGAKMPRDVWWCRVGCLVHRLRLFFSCANVC